MSELKEGDRIRVIDGNKVGSTGTVRNAYWWGSEVALDNHFIIPDPEKEFKLHFPSHDLALMEESQ